MEPWRLKRWRLPSHSVGAEFYTCARPGRSKGAHARVPDKLLHDWVRGLPTGGNVVVVSLLGQKPDGTSEFSYYSFSDNGRSFQDWLDQNYQGKAIRVLEHPTCDFRAVLNDTLTAVSSDILRLLSEKQTPVLMDSGGLQRTMQVCRHIGAIEDSSS